MSSADVVVSPKIFARRDPAAVAALGLPATFTSCLPEVRSSSEVFGVIECGPLCGSPISGLIGDQQAATLGQFCVRPGDVKNTYGTGSFLLMNTGTTPIQSMNGLLTTVC